MNINIKTIVDTVNRINKKELYSYNEIKNMETVINTELKNGEYKYMNYGGNCIVFCNDTKVFKICKQPSDLIKQFINYSDKLNTLSLLPVDEIIFMTDTYTGYTQQRCKLIETVTKNDIINLLKIYFEMVKNKTIFHDLFFRNFGYIGDKLYLFDYHYDYTELPSDFDIYNMILNVLYVFKGKHYEDFAKGKRHGYNYYKNNNFDIPNVPDYVCDFFRYADLLRSATDHESIVELLGGQLDCIIKNLTT